MAAMGNDSFIAKGMAPPQRILFLPEKICMEWQRRQRAGAGLHNLGNTCFLNSVLQCLTYTPPLANYLLSREHRRSCRQQGFCMMCIMEAHVNKVLHSSASAIQPRAVISVLTRIGEHFQLGMQEDAHEFLCYTVNAMQRARLSGSSDLDISSQETTIIHQIFGGFLRSRVTCLSCKAASDTYEAFFDIPLDIRGASSVTGALEDFVKPEQLGGENGYKCSKCEQLATASKRLTIHRSSNVLTLCLKRFDPFSGRKISKVVQYPEYLDLGAYMSQAAGERLLYSLYAVLVHEGSSCQAGHYYCFVKASNGRWYKMNDASVDLCDIKTVLCQRAYLLFYARHHDLTPGAGAECQETKSTCVAKLDQVLKSPFSGVTGGLRNQEGGENMHRIQRKRQTQDSAGTPPQHCGRKRARSDTEEGEKLNRSQPDCHLPGRGALAGQKCRSALTNSCRVAVGTHAALRTGRETALVNGRSSGGEGVHGLSGHRADMHPGSVGEQQLGKYSLEQRALPPVPVHPESAGSCQANGKQTCRKRKHSCAKGDESAPERKR